MGEEFRPTEANVIRRESMAFLREHDRVVAGFKRQLQNAQALIDLQRIYVAAAAHDKAAWNEAAMRLDTLGELKDELYHATVRLTETHVPIPLDTLR